MYKTYVENFLDDTNIPAANSNATTAAEFVKQTAKPTYEQILPDYLQVFPEEWNMKDFLYYWAVGLVTILLVFQVKLCVFTSRACMKRALGWY